MKISKRKVLVVALAICIIAVLSMGTLAWFSDSDYVENTFKIADSDDDTPDDIFSIDVWENTPDGDKDQDGYVYEDILPGDTLKKEARIENTGYYDQYVRVIITISNAEAWCSIADQLGVSVESFFDGYVDSDWVHGWNNLQDATSMPENLVYVKYYKDIVSAGEVIELFDNIVIPEGLTREQAAELNNSFNITVKAQAVQTENVVPAGTAAEDAPKVAFDTVGLDFDA